MDEVIRETRAAVHTGIHGTPATPPAGSGSGSGGSGLPIDSNGPRHRLAELHGQLCGVSVMSRLAPSHPSR